MYTLVLCTAPMSIGSWIIRVLTWGRWSHSAILHRAEGLVYHATGRLGYHREPQEQFFARYPAHELREIDVPPVQWRSADLWLHGQLGKPYDWTAVLSFGLARWLRWSYRSWQDDDAWFCSEATETFRTLFERRRFRADLARITPAHQDALAD